MRSAVFQTILVAIDSTEISHKAFYSALTAAKALNAELMIVHILGVQESDSPQPPDTYSTSEMVVIDKALREQYQKDWNNYVARYDALLKQKAEEAQAIGIQASCIHAHGSAPKAICKLAREHNVNLIVLGSHQRRGVAELMMGSTSNYVMHHAPCSVLIVHPDIEIEVTAAPRQKKSTVGVG